MNEQNINNFLSTHSKYFPQEKIIAVKDALSRCSDDKLTLILSEKYLSSGAMTALSFFLGGLGIDRFVLKDTGLGLLKFFTGGCCGWLWLIDLFIIGKKTKEKNFETFCKAISFASVLQ